MPTTRRRRTRAHVRPIPDTLWEMLGTGELPNRGPGWVEAFQQHMGFISDRDAYGLRATWEAVREDYLADWIEERPGTRPAAWWRFDAPERRQRLGGRGDDYAAAGWHQTYPFGLPAYWLTQSLVDGYNGRTITPGTPRTVWDAAWIEGHFPFVGYDPTDPPRFESEAAFLERLGLLDARERRRLKPAAFAPVAIAEDDGAEGER